MMHVPDLKSHRHVLTDNLVCDIRFLLSCVDFVHCFSITGGEAFLHPGLNEVVRACADKSKVGMVEIITNGTVIPDKELLVALREADVTVKISGYPQTLQPEVETLKRMLNEHGVRHMHSKGAFWRDTIGSGFGQPEEGCAKRRFSVCVQQLCMPIFDGKLHVCGESAVLLEEGLIPDCEDDYIDLRKIEPTRFDGQWRRLRKRHMVSACLYCQGSTYQSPKIPVAAQRGKGMDK